MNLLAAGAWSLDLVFFILIFVGILLGVFFGFLKGVCKIAGTILSVVLASAFCFPFKNNLESWFGLQTALQKSIGSAIGAGLITTVISFIVLVVVIRLLAWFLGSAGTALAEKNDTMKLLNRFFGGLFGLIVALAVIFLLLAIFSWISAPGIDAFISKSSVVGAIYNWKWFRYASRFAFL